MIRIVRGNLNLGRWRRRRLALIVLASVLLAGYISDGMHWYIGNEQRWFALGSNSRLGGFSLSCGGKWLPTDDLGQLWSTGHELVGGVGTMWAPFAAGDRRRNSVVLEFALTRVVTVPVMLVLAAGWLAGWWLERRQRLMRGFPVVEKAGTPGLSE